jgi:hypothetical protein
MADERDKTEFDSTEKQEGQQTTGGQQSHQSEFGQQGGQPAEAEGQSSGGNDNETGNGTPLSSGSEPPRSMGTKGSEFGQFGDSSGSGGQQGQSGTGQSDLGSQSGSTLSGRTDQQDMGSDQPGSVGGASRQQGESFILKDEEGSASAKTTGGSDFAEQGRGATEEEAEDEEGAGPQDVGSGGPGSSI